MNAHSKTSKLATRSTYRHGDLQHALLECAIELARKGGADAVVLREVTRQAGVTPNAAYRHFADRQSILQAVGRAAQSELANVIENEISATKKCRDKAKDARAKFRAVGVGYIKFAQMEPGLFGLAFSVHENLSNSANLASAGRNGRTPFQLLSDALDGLEEAGVLSPERRNYAEFLAWSAVHGFSLLKLNGPLRGLTDTQVDVIVHRLIDMVERGL